MSDISSDPPLVAATVPVGEPLPWPLFDALGKPLMPAGIVLDAAQAAFLGTHFAPKRRAAVDEASAAAAASTASGADTVRLALTGDAIVGLRRRASSTRTMCRFRLIGEHPAGGVFLRPLRQRDVDLTPGDAIEAMAVGREAIYWFTARVEAVAFEPVAYVILSAPRDIKRMRERRDVRVPVHLAARYAVEGGEGLGVVLDISLSGLSLAADRTLAQPKQLCVNHNTY